MDTSQSKLHSIPLPYVLSALSRVPFSVVREGTLYLVIIALALVFSWPLMGPDFPPGVDTPTFLHLSWVTKLAITGNLEQPFTDSFWYGGFPYLQSYPPLSYGLVGVVSGGTGLDLFTTYRIFLVLAYVGLGLASYWMALELGRRWWPAVLTATLTMVAYPVLAALFVWGWFSTLMVLPFILLAYTLLERSIRTGQVWVAAGGWGLFCPRDFDPSHDRFCFGPSSDTLVSFPLSDAHTCP